MTFWMPLDSRGTFSSRTIPLESLPPHLKESIEQLDITSYYQSGLTAIYGSKEKIPEPVTVKSEAYLLFSDNIVVRDVDENEAGVEEEDEMKEMIEVSISELVCLYGGHEDGQWYTYLASLPDCIVNKTDSYIGYTTNPLADIHLHNAKLLPTPDRDTGSAAPHWMLDIVLGPFLCEELAKQCGKLWVIKTRGKKSKRNRASILAGFFNVPLYTFQEKLIDTTMTHLLRDYNVPPSARGIWSSLQSNKRTDTDDNL